MTKPNSTGGRGSGGHKLRAPRSGPLRAVLYRRVSSERQGERVSPEVQLSEAEDYARAHGHAVVAVYTDTDRYRVRGRLVEPSGSRVDRPDFQRMLADGAAGKFDLIIAWKEDRLYRGVHPAVLVDDLIEQTGITVELVRETFDRKLLFLKAAIGRMELDNIRERTEMGMRARVKKGLIHGGPVPAGYTAVHAGTDSAAVGYVLDPAWRGFFDDLARWYIARLPLAEIARRLGSAPRTGKPWLDATISFMLRNPFYRGLLAYGWQSGHPEFTVPGQHEAAWNPETCAAVERELARRGGKHNAPRGRALLSGIVRCGVCGYPMACGTTLARNPDGGDRYRYRYYGCARPVAVRSGRWFGRRTHAPNYINETRLLGLLRRALEQTTPEEIDTWLAATARALGGPAPDDGERQGRLEAEAARLQGRLADLAVGLDGVRHQSPAATEAIVAAITSAGKALDRVRADLDELDGRRVGALDLEQARAAMLRLTREPALLASPSPELQVVLRVAFQALYVANGQICEPVTAWQD